MIESLTPAEQSLVIATLARRKLELYRPYDKQRVFHESGVKYRERLLRAGNQLGKTFAAAAETAMHATGKYPAWWMGRKFKKAPVIWCAGVTGEVVRDTIQRLLVGDVANPGTGLIPPLDITETMPSRGVADLMDTILVKHVSGSVSRIRLKYYEQGREKFQGDTVDFGWLDEEPPEDIYLEMLTRTNATNGIICMTFTPLKGMSVVVRRFLQEQSPDRIDVNMTIDDALHIKPEERQRIIESYPLHERNARIRGEPMLGSGAIFPIADEDIMCEPFDTRDVPFYWMELAGLDFGWDHPTAAVKGLYNPQDDIIYITNCYRRREATPLQHAAALKPWGSVPFAWPHDGLQHDKGSGVPLKEIYRQQGLNMLSDNARFEDGSNGVEAGIAEMLMRMETGRLKVFRHLSEWFEEKRMYHRREGKIWKEFDDLMCLHPDTEIITDKGKKRIIDLVGTEGRILTSYGKWTDYKNCRMTREAAELVEVTYSDGFKLLCTPDHKLLSDAGDWVCAIDSAHMICHNAISHRRKIWTKFYTRELNLRNLVNIIVQPTMIFYTGLFGESILGKFHQNIIFTIKMVTRMIIRLKTSNAFLEASISQNIKRDIQESPWRQSKQEKYGVKHRKVKTTIEKWGSAINIFYESSVSLFVSNVINFLSLSPRGSIGFVPITANPSGGEMRDWMTLSGNVNSVQKYSKLINIPKLYIALKAAAENIGRIRQKEKRILVVSAVQAVNQKSNVYCMEVPKTFAFALANGAVVHNCASRYLLMCLRFAQRVRKPPSVIGEHYGAPKDSYNDPDWNPLGHKYIDEMLGGKK